MCVYQRSNLFETRQIVKLVQHRENMLNPSPDLLIGVASHQTQIVTPIPNNRSDNNSALVLWKLSLLPHKNKQNEL